MENSSAPQEPAPSASPEAVATLPRPAPERPAVDQLPPFRVLLHNDDVNDQQFIIESILELTTHDKPRATEITLEANNTGVALLLVTHKERAELYQEQFTSKKVIVTIEPAT